jgi:hypothetical protein
VSVQCCCKRCPATTCVAKKKPEYKFQFLDDALSTSTTTTSHSKNNLNHLLNFNRGAIVSTASDAAFRQQQQASRLSCRCDTRAHPMCPRAAPVQMLREKVSRQFTSVIGRSKCVDGN